MRKDEGLDRLADTINVAQFVAFEPGTAGPRQTYARILGLEPNRRFSSDAEAVAALLATSGEAAVNVRSYIPEDPRSKEFVRGLDTVDDIVGALHRLTADGLHTIVNEAINTSDGGVSGVIQGDLIEFAPDRFPRDVEQGGFTALPRSLGLAVLETAFRFRPDIDLAATTRLEFSLHPQSRGWLGRRTIGWEIEENVIPAPAVAPAWPNPFSRMLGDKVFGLMIAHHLGLAVPECMVVGRRVAPFSFGTPTGSSEIWTRTCPSEQQPGRFTTVRGWTDPFALLKLEDRDDRHEIASVLAQAAVAAAYSGASHTFRDGTIVVEGKRGNGDDLMMGTAHAEPLPTEIDASVRAVHKAQAGLGAIRTEWVHDGSQLWIVQFHIGASAGTRTMLSEGAADHWIDFDPNEGLPALRNLLSRLEPATGLNLISPIGFTSHLADTIRRANVAARLVI